MSVDNEMMFRALKQVPEARLRIIDLVWKVVGEDGEPDSGKMAFYGKELEEAFREVREYIDSIEKVVRCFRNIIRS